MILHFLYSHWRWISAILFFKMLFPFLLWSNSNSSTTVKQAEKLFHEKLYGDALPLYSELLAFSLEEELKTQLTLRLATCHLEEKQPDIALNLLSSLSPLFCHNQSLFLMSLAYRHLGQSAQALHLLQQCSLSKEHPANNLISLEQGYHLMRIGDFANAEKVFKSIHWQINQLLSYYLAQLQLAKIFLINHQFHQALQTLSLLSNSLPSDHLLNIESTYLKGWALLAQQRASQAAACFEELLPKLTNGSIQVLNGLIVSYLKQALTIEQQHLDQLKNLLLKTDYLLQELLIRAPTETSYLLLTDFYLIKAKSLSDPDSYKKAQQLLNQIELFSSQEGLRQALLKRAAAAPSYQERNSLYEQLSTDLALYPPDFCMRIWFLKGLNDFEEGLRCQQQAGWNQNTKPFERAIEAFKQAIPEEITLYPMQTARVLKYLALAYAYLPEKFQTRQAWQVISQLIANDSLLLTFEHREEIYCLAAWIALRLTDKDLLRQAKSWLQHAQSKTFSMHCLKLEGMICLQLGDWQQADHIFALLLQNELYASSHSEAWFWRAYIADQQHHFNLKKEYLQKAYTQDVQSPYASTAYFHFYSYREYMQGGKKVIKHLQAMPGLFPAHPLLINAYYLIGLYHKKDHFSQEGQILRHKDLTASIDAFQLAESKFDTLFEKNLIPFADLSYFIQLRYQAQLERAEANLAIAQNSNGGKRKIYLEYAEEVFKQLIQDFKTPEALANQLIAHLHSPYPKIWAEAEFQLAKIYEEKKEWKKAEDVLNTSLEHYHQAQINQSDRLMHVWYMKGKLASQQANDEMALKYFLEAEKSVQKHVNPNEKLDLWIQQSLCYTSLNQLEEAMRVLSRVINEDVISPLRVKAMFLRAEIYELQGRPELAIKQLEATADKGGEWAQKAKEKLEKLYGY